MEQELRQVLPSLYLLLIAAVSPSTSAQAIYPAEESISADIYKIVMAGGAYAPREATKDSLWKKQSNYQFNSGRSLSVDGQYVLFLDRGRKAQLIDRLSNQVISQSSSRVNVGDTQIDIAAGYAYVSDAKGLHLLGRSEKGRDISRYFRMKRQDNVKLLRAIESGTFAGCALVVTSNGKIMLAIPGQSKLRDVGVGDDETSIKLESGAAILSRAGQDNHFIFSSDGYSLQLLQLTGDPENPELLTVATPQRLSAPVKAIVQWSQTNIPLMVPATANRAPFFYDLVNERELKWLDQTLTSRWRQLEDPSVKLTPDGQHLLIQSNEQLQMIHVSPPPDTNNQYVAAVPAGQFEISSCFASSCNISIDNTGQLLSVQVSAFEDPKAAGYHELFDISGMWSLDSVALAAIEPGGTLAELEKHLQASFTSDYRFDEVILDSTGSKAYLPIDVFGWLEFDVAPWSEERQIPRDMLRLGNWKFTTDDGSVGLLAVDAYVGDEPIPRFSFGRAAPLYPNRSNKPRSASAMAPNLREALDMFAAGFREEGLDALEAATIENAGQLKLVFQEINTYPATYPAWTEEHFTSIEAARLLLRAYRELVDDSVALLNVSCEAVLSPGRGCRVVSSKTNLLSADQVITAVNGLEVRRSSDIDAALTRLRKNQWAANISLRDGSRLQIPVNRKIRDPDSFVWAVNLYVQMAMIQGQVNVPRQVQNAFRKLDVEVPQEAKDRIELAVMASRILTGHAKEVYSSLVRRKEWARAYSTALSEEIIFYPLRVNKKKLGFILGLKPEEITGPVVNPYHNDEFVDFNGDTLPPMNKKSN